MDIFLLGFCPHCVQVMAYEACRDVMEALRAKYSGPLQVSEMGKSVCLAHGFAKTVTEFLVLTIGVGPFHD
jgi:hypothetical protein